MPDDWGYSCDYLARRFKSFWNCFAGGIWKYLEISRLEQPENAVRVNSEVSSGDQNAAKNVENKHKSHEISDGNMGSWK